MTESLSRTGSELHASFYALKSDKADALVRIYVNNTIRWAQSGHFWTTHSADFE